MRRREALIWALGLSLLLTAFLVAPASAKTLGPSFSESDGDFGTGCDGGNCIFMQRKIPGVTLKAPFSGRVTKWRFVSTGPYTFALNVLRPEGGGEFELVRATPAEDVIGAGKWAFSSHLRIRKGDRVGLYMSGGGGISMRYDSAARYAVFEPVPLIGGSGSPGPAFDDEVLFNATIRR